MYQCRARKNLRIRCCSFSKSSGWIFLRWILRVARFVNTLGHGHPIVKKFLSVCSRSQCLYKRSMRVYLLLGQLGHWYDFSGVGWSIIPLNLFKSSWREWTDARNDPRRSLPSGSSISFSSCPMWRRSVLRSFVRAWRFSARGSSPWCGVFRFLDVLSMGAWAAGGKEWVSWARSSNSRKCMIQVL